ncbi:HET-domain-containing protein [Xylariaceae sp. FL1651]|nr:HET-domain-containing protein [Xylariaceae sp. FL1651]
MSGRSYGSVTQEQYPPQGLTSPDLNPSYLPQSRVVQNTALHNDPETEFQCEFCSKLSISRLIELNEQDPGRSSFLETLYQHHASLQDLEASAQQGCAFCLLVIANLKGTEVIEFPPPRAKDSSPRSIPTTTAYSAAKALPTNKVRVRIGATSVHDHKSSESVEVLDMVEVYIGDEDPVFSRPIGFVLKTPRGTPPDDPEYCPIYLKHYRLGRYQLDPDLSSRRNMCIAEGWLRTCRERHIDCPVAGGNTFLPTRVIDVGPANGSQAPRLVSGEGIKAEYIALSHCWGGQIVPVLNASTLGPFRSAIPMTELPANFRDAIVITQNLGIRYLWIDSLCILQDSKEDWEKESRKMGDVYRNATLTISASASPGSKHGIFGSAQAHSPASPAGHAYLRIFSKSSGHQGEIRVEIEDKNEENLEKLESTGPLNSRGWTLQESILSPRQLFYGTRQIYWRCKYGFQCAEGLPSKSARNPNNQFNDLRQMIQGNPDNNTQHSHMVPPGTSREWQNRRLPPGYGMETKNNQHNISNGVNEELLFTISGNYYELVEEYSRRYLTVPSDKLPAFSGLARAVCGVFKHHDPFYDSAQMSTPAAYLAGIWVADLYRGLAWYGSEGLCPHVVSYRAPSWSWASTDKPITFWDGFYPSELDLNILRYEVELQDPENPFGEVKYAELIVSGRIKKLRRSRQVFGSDMSDETLGHCYFDEDDESRQRSMILGSALFLSNRDNTTSKDKDYILSSSEQFRGAKRQMIDQSLISTHKYLVLLLSCYDDGLEDDGTVSAACLVIRPAVGRSREGYYERMGFARLECQDPEWIKSWDVETIKLG